MNKPTMKPLLAAAFLATAVVPVAQAGVAAFSAHALSAGYDLGNRAQEPDKAGHEGQCGGMGKSQAPARKEDKAGKEGRCGNMGKPASQSGPKPENIPVDKSKASSEGKCGEGMCGASMGMEKPATQDNKPQGQ